jgi:hypothetical protein
MANHLRQQIREAVAIRLSGLTTTTTRVYQSRLHPLSDSNLPCLLVNTDSEEIATLTLQPHPVMERNMTLAVRCIGKAVANLDDTLDTMLKEVETALGTVTDPTYGGLVKSMVPTGISIEMDDGLEKPVGIASLNYLVTYYTADGSPTASA